MLTPITVPPSTWRFNCIGLIDDTGIHQDRHLLDLDDAAVHVESDMRDAGPVGSGAEHRGDPLAMPDRTVCLQSAPLAFPIPIQRARIPAPRQSAFLLAC